MSRLHLFLRVNWAQGSKNCEVVMSCGAVPASGRTGYRLAIEGVGTEGTAYDS
jgi:hypothetical protein